jgi:hypothetical protein
MRTSERFYLIAALGVAFCFSAAGQKADDQGVSLGNQSAMPVFARFLRTSMSGTLSSSSASGFQDNATGAIGTGRSSVDGGRIASNTTTGPMHGMVLVEVPLSALKFDTDGGKYGARAKVKVWVHDSDGKVVFTAEKEIGVKGKEKQLEARRQGSLFFVRGLTLLGGSEYTVEAQVEDLQAQQTGATQNPIVPAAGAPGLNASDAMFVRKLDNAVDSFEADQNISVEGQGLAPILDPVFPAGRKFGMQLFFVLYPDIDGGQPDMSLQLVSNGRMEAQGPLPFKHNVHERAFEGKTNPSAPSGAGQLGNGGLLNTASQHEREFPYLADMQFSQLPEGDYQAVIKIRQGGRIITREVPFKVAGTPPPPAK